MIPDAIPELEVFATCGLTDLSQLAHDRKCAFGFEPSVRFRAEQLEARRGLFSFSLADFGSQAWEIIMAQCRSMHAPPQLIASAGRFLASAAFVHFGFEQSGFTLIGKCYLELPPPDSVADLSSSRLQFLGFKWSMNDRSIATVTRYRTVSRIDWTAVEQTMLTESDASLQPVLRQVLAIAAPVANTAEDRQLRDFDVPLSLLEIEEEGSDRKSYDLNIYDRDLPVSAFEPSLREAARVLSIDSAAISDWLSRVGREPAGHFATGISRNRQPFLTVYYGARQVRLT